MLWLKQLNEGWFYVLDGCLQGGQPWRKSRSGQYNQEYCLAFVELQMSI